MFKDCSRITSGREINKEIMDLNDTLSDVPVKESRDIINPAEIDDSFSIEESEQILDNLCLLSPLISQFSAKLDNTSSKKHTPSFKHDGTGRSDEKSVRSFDKTNVSTILDFNKAVGHMPLLELCNIPEVLDDSYMFSETTYKRNPNDPYSSSNYTSAANEDSNKPNLDIGEASVCCISPKTKYSNSPEKFAGKLNNALEVFLSQKHNPRDTPVFGEGERLTFSNQTALQMLKKENNPVSNNKSKQRINRVKTQSR